MIEITREFVAYALIGLVAIVGGGAYVVTRRRRHRERLRRRGIKTYGH